MKYGIMGLLFGVSFLSAQQDSIRWKHSGRGGIVSADTSNGGFGYYRLNRRTPITFRDLRFFAYGLQKDSFIYIRYKSSDKYATRPRFYRYTTTSYRKNTRTGVKLQYHFNQGFGAFLKEYSNGLVNMEIGHAFDISDYLNEERKTSYIKTGIFWDHHVSRFSTKFELEHFQQISEINGSDLSRNQYMLELIFHFKNGVSLNMNYELEDYLDKNQSKASSVTFAVGWQGNLKWTF